jgi:4'-phosphopantetheinyl transferase
MTRQVGDCPRSSFFESAHTISPLTKPISPRVTIWSVSLEDCQDASLLREYEGLLSQGEREQWMRFAFEKDRHCYLVSRALLRTVLARCLSTHPVALRFAKTSKGKPFLDHPNGGQLEFNLSHCAGMIVLAVGDQRSIGIDVECNDCVAPISIADHYFTEQEVRALMVCEQDHRNKQFFDLWTLKESYLKATGEGLSIPLNSFGFALDHPGNVELYGSTGWSDDANRWWLAQWKQSSIHVAALCVELTNQANSPTLYFYRTIPLLRDEIFEPVFERISQRLIQK